MQVVHEVQGDRVKGLSFHPKIPYIAASFHTGAVVIYDYKEQKVTQTYSVSDKPVRCVDFHQTEPIFVCGCDDNSIRIYDYTQNKCISTLDGHSDFIRSVEFHKTKPFIVSASDDQTVRVWDWKRNQCIAVLEGHSHYVLSASFHKDLPYIISASLDCNICLWNVSSLFKDPQQSNEFSCVKIKSHNDGINHVAWAYENSDAYIGTIVSCSDDKTVGIWKITQNEVPIFFGELTGHTENVTSAIILSEKKTAISCSEDGTVRSWDIMNYQQKDMLTREKNRFWTLAAHPRNNLVAAGHDNGFIILDISK